MIDQTYAPGDESAREDDFEWVNAWAVTSRRAADPAPPAVPSPSLPVPPLAAAAAAMDKRDLAERDGRAQRDGRAERDTVAIVGRADSPARGSS
jgi:hypothetical protein